MHQAKIEPTPEVLAANGGMTKRDLIAALWNLWERIDPQGVGQLSEYTDAEAAEVTKARLQALIDSGLGDRAKA